MGKITMKIVASWLVSASESDLLQGRSRSITGLAVYLAAAECVLYK